MGREPVGIALTDVDLFTEGGAQTAQRLAGRRRRHAQPRGRLTQALRFDQFAHQLQLLDVGVFHGQALQQRLCPATAYTERPTNT